MGYEVVASFGYVQNDDGEWVPKDNTPLKKQRQDRQHEDNEQGSSSTTLHDIINRIKQLQTFVGTTFDALETRFGNIDMVMASRFDVLQSRVGNIEEQLQHMQTDFHTEPHT
ncbi:hypothetical protein LR48_Vigan01g073700 [Vigna angularis]|uniref:Uncharacterized protein n=1 Tax=Phaseolus angularis TaxID=3914 RepID=A0A0L9TL69_PHAAN|nr:hypothetical protein LR48_Vigan01g073700 [Vigna angularis]